MLRQQQKLTFSGTVTYRDQEGKVFSEPFKWNLPSSGDLLHISRKTTHDIAETLEKIEKNLNRIASGSKVPLLRVITEDEYREEQREQHERFKAMTEGTQEKEKDKTGKEKDKTGKDT